MNSSMRRDHSGESLGQMGKLRALLNWSILSHFDEIDRYYKAGKGKPQTVSSWKVVSTVYFSCIMLWLMNYLALSGSLQTKGGMFLLKVSEVLGIWDGRTNFVDVLALGKRASWVLMCTTFYLLLPALYVRFVLKRRIVPAIGLSPRGYFKHLPLYTLLFVPVAICVWIVSYHKGFQATYPFLRWPANWQHLIAWELLYAMQFVALEFFFRGFMLTELRYVYGWRSVLFMVVPYCMIHFPKPALEALGAVIAGSILGVLALRVRNIWGGVTIHVAVAWWMDIAALIQRGWFNAQIH